jgi:gliding motility-associated-like protein
VNLTKTTTFKAVVKSNDCASAESNLVKITIPTTTTGTATPIPDQICSGATATLKLEGYTPGAQIYWQKWVSGNFVNISGASGNQYTTLNLTDDTKYRAMISVSNCTPVPSNEVIVYVTPSLNGGEVTASPSSICSGTSSIISLSKTTGSNYKWQKDDGSGFADIPGAPENTNYQTPNLTVVTKYRAYVTGGTCAPVYSDTATVSIIPASKGGTATAKDTVCSGTNTNITLSGYRGTIEWEVDDTGTGNGPFASVNPSSNSTTYTATNLTKNLTRFRAKVTQSGCTPAYSNIVVIKVKPASKVGTLSTSSTTICNGGTVTFGLTGSVGSIQWQSDTANHVLQNIPNATSASYTTFPITKNTAFQAVVTNGNCPSAFSGTVAISAVPGLSGGKAVAIPSTVCSGTKTIIHLRNYTGNITWQTDNGSGNGTFTTISGQTDSLYTTPNLSVQTKYRAILKSGTCPQAISEEATVSILTASAGGKATATSSAICTNTATIITLTDYVGTIQWQMDSVNGYKNISGAHAATLNTGNLTKNTSFRAIVTSNSCNPDTSTTAFISVMPASVGGTATPLQSSICSGGTATINLTNEVGALIQWQYDSTGTNGWANIPNAFEKSYTTGPLTQQTRFRARVKNGDCTISSSSVATIYITPTLLGGTAKATPSNICSGTNTTIKLTGQTGSQIQWQINTGSGYADIPNQKDTILVTSPLTSPSNFRARVNGSGCPQVLSTAAAVGIIPLSVAGTITVNPSTICSGETSLLTLNGNTGSIQWQSDETGGFSDIVGQKGQTYTTPPLTTSTSYRVVVKSSSCPDAKSSPVSVTVVPASVSGLAKATPPTVCNGGTSKLTLTGFVGDKFQWQVDTSGAGGFKNILGATDPDYTTPGLTQPTTYRAIVTNGDCTPIPSNTVSVNITNVLNGGTAKATSSIICKGTFTTIKLTGQSGSIQWQTNNGGGPFKDITINGNSNTLTTPNLTVPTTYRAVLTSGGCTPVYSNEVTISIIPASVGGTATPKYPTVCSGEVDTINLTGNVGSIQWQKDSSSIFVNIPGATGSFYVTKPLTIQATYRAMVTSSGCAPVASSEALIFVSPGSKAGVISASATKICTNATSTLTLNGYIGSVQWQSDANGGVFSDIPGATGMSYTTLPLNQPTHFRAIVRNGNCPSAISAVILITITPSLTGGTTSATPSPVCSGTSSTLTLKGHSGAVRWQTYVSNSWKDIDTVMATDTFYVTPPLFVATRYRAIVSSKGCASKTSTETIVAVSPGSIAGSAAAVASEVCEGETGTINLSGYTGAIKWQIKNASGVFEDIALATSNSYTTLALTKATSYRAIVTNGICASDTSNVVTISIIPPSVGGIPVASAPTVCIGGTTTITLTQYTGDNIKWQRDSSFFDVYIPGAVGPVYSTPSLATKAKYRAVVSNKGCHTVTSAYIEIDVTDQLEGGIATVVPSTVCNNSTTTLNLKNYKGSIQWQKETPGGFVNIPNATTTPFTTDPLTAQTRFLAVVSSGSCPTVYSNIVTAYVTQKLNAGVITANPSTICNGESTKLKINGHTGNVQWQRDSMGTFVNIPGQTADTCRIPVVLQSTTYRAKVSSGSCTPVYTDSILVSVNVVPTPTGDSVQKFCSILSPTIKTLVLKDVTTDTIKWYAAPTGGKALPNSTILVDNGVYYAARAVDGCETYKRLKVRVVIYKSATILNQPTNVTTCPGSTAQFTVRGDGTGFTYRWLVDETGTGTNYKYLIDNSTYNGCTTDTLKISNVTNFFSSYSYKCVVKGTCSGADSVLSNPAILLVTSNTTISRQPEPIKLCYGNIADLYVTAIGNNSLTYQWQVDSTNGTFVDLKTDTIFMNTTNDSMRIKAFTPSMTKYKFRCVVKNPICGTTTNSQETMIYFDEECNVYPVDVPTGFSPDGDGVNDKLVIQGLENYPGSVVRVFNIWGDLVYEKEDYQNDWDAKANVKNVVGEGKLPAGTYYIYVDLKKGAKRKATFLIIKY